MRATVRDVARLAGVSPKTVSNVVNLTQVRAASTATTVEQALLELDYVPNLSARGLRNGRTGVIALALPDLSTPYSAEVAHHVVDAASDWGWTVQIEETGTSSADSEAALLSRARSHLIDGLILNPVLLETSAVQRGVSLPPVVLIGEVDQPVADHVWTDNVAGAHAITTLLLEQGNRRIAVLGRMRSATSRLRVQGYRRALRDAGVTADRSLEIGCSQWNARGAAHALDEWLQTHPPMDALFCFTDSMALGAMHTLDTHGLSVPTDVAVAGYDDVPEASFFRPSLTTVGFDKRAFAETALQLLAQRIAEPDRPSVTSTVPFTIMERDSTASR